MSTLSTSRYCGHGVRIMSASAPAAASSGAPHIFSFASFTTGSCSLSLAPPSCSMVASDGEFFVECVFSL